MAVDDAEFVDDREIGPVHRLILGRKARNQVRADGDVRAACAQTLHQMHGIGARMAAFHSLEHEIVAVLQRKMQVRHHPRFPGEQLEQLRIDLHPVERGHAQPCQSWEAIQDRPDKCAKPGWLGRSWPQEVTSTPVSTTSGTPSAMCRSIWPEPR